MSEIPEWLPKRLYYKDYAGNWDKFLKDVYSIFTNDFCERKIYLGQMDVDFDRTIKNNWIEGFRHILEGREDKRLIQSDDTILRAEKIAWVKPIIQNYNDRRILKWENKRGRKNKMLLWLKDIEIMGYVVVLYKKSEKSVFLETAYPVNWKRRRIQFEKEYSAYMSSKRRP